MADVIRGQGDQYFAFLVVGLIAFNVVSSTVYALPGGLQTATSTGTLEALLATPTSVTALLPVCPATRCCSRCCASCVMLVAAGCLGARVAWLQLGASLPIVALIVLAHLPIAIITAGDGARVPDPRATAAARAAGVDVSRRRVLPDDGDGFRAGSRSISAFLPLTYGLTALRAVLLEGRLDRHRLARALDSARVHGGRARRQRHRRSGPRSATRAGREPGAVLSRCRPA